jgi:quinol monooxygenase YgiN
MANNAFVIKALHGVREKPTPHGTILANELFMVVSIVRLFPQREQRRHVINVLRSIRNPIQAHPRCLGCYLCEEDDYDEAILYMEQWDSEEDLYHHIQSDFYRRILAAAELSHTRPDFQFHYVRKSRGIDLIESLRIPRLHEHKH